MILAYQKMSQIARFTMHSMATVSLSTSNLDYVSALDTEVNAGLWQYLNGDLDLSHASA